MLFGIGKVDRLWTAETGTCLYGGMRPVFDPITNSILVSDGWGTTYTSIRVRRVDLATGKEAASVRLGNSGRCACFLDDNTVLVATDSKLFALDRFTLKEKERWTSRVPRYTDFILPFGRSVVIMNWRGPSMNHFHLDQPKCMRRQAGSCEGLFSRGTAALVCSGKEGMVWSYSPSTGKLKELLSTPQFLRATYSADTDALAVALGNPFTVTADTFQGFTKSRVLRIYPLAQPQDWFEMQTVGAFSWMEFSADGRQLFLAFGSEIRVYFVEERRLVQGGVCRLPNKYETECVIPERGIAIAAHHYHPDPSVIAAVALPH